jgi:diacylglycerol kinase (ATP)
LKENERENDENDEQEEDEEEDIDYYFQNQNTLLLPSPCSITFTLSPTNCDYPAFPLPGIVPPGSPPALPSSPPAAFPASPTIELTHDFDEIEIPGPRTRRRSISRQEAVSFEPTGTSLDNISNSSDPEQHQLQPVNEIKVTTTNVERINVSAPKPACEPFVCDIFLAVPDLKRDRAASVDSCFTKVSSAAKTEEVQPPEGDLNLLTVPSSGAVRSRSVDIVLPTEQQARYKALALAGPASNIYNKG